MHKKLPSPREAKARIPLVDRFISEARTTVQNILTKKDKRRALILGPCSIDDIDAALEFAEQLKKIEMGHFFPIMRVFVEKARTTIGWKGFLYDPDLDGSYQMKKGIYLTQHLLTELAKLGIPAAAEFVDPILAPFFADLLSWGFIGARTSESQTHRQFASSLAYPVGFKNATDGNIDVAIQGALSARYPHTFAAIDEEGSLSQTSTSGNPFSHLVLRGSIQSTNFEKNHVINAKKRLLEQHMDPLLVIDCSHGNSSRISHKQKESFRNVIEQIEKGDEGIRGLMLESYLKSGNQSLSEPLEYGVSVTDSCLSIAETKELIDWANAYLPSSSKEMSSVQN